MTIWLLAIVLMASLAALGYRQGAIRVACSLIGIFLGALLAVPLGKPFVVLLKAFGVVHPVILWLVPPVIAFIVVSFLVKAGAFAIHHKVEVYFKYKAGDLRLTLWERMNRRLGACLGVVNGVAYTVLITFVVYVLGYWTVQMETGTEQSRMVKLVNRMAEDLQSSGFSRSARSLENMPKSFYEAADILGKIYRNPTLEARLSRYPAFLMLGERPDFQTLAKDSQFAEMRARQDSVAALMQYGPIQGIVNDTEFLKTVWGIIEPNLGDLAGFLDSGVSEKYKDETILGRWNCSVRGMVAAYRRAKPNATALEMARVRASFQTFYSKANLVIGFTGSENQLVMKQYPKLGGTTTEFQTGTGTWTGANGNYQITVNIGGGEMKASATIANDQLTVTVEKLTLVFSREL